MPVWAYNIYTGGKHGSLLGKTISMSLAVHNIPEGMAVAGVLTARGVDKAQTGKWHCMSN